MVGTIEYMSPERIQGREIDRRADIYALGVVLYEMLTGRGLFSTTSEYELMRAQVEQPPPPPREFQPGIPQAVEAVIMRSLAKKPEYRISTAAEFQQDLRAALRPADIPATRSRHTPVPDPQQPLRPKETVLYEQPEQAASAPAPPPTARPPTAAPETRFVAQAAPHVEAPPSSPPRVVAKPPEPSEPATRPPEPPAPLGQEPKVDVRPANDATDRPPTQSPLAETMPMPPVLARKEAERETTATPPLADWAREQTAPDKAASPVIAAPTLATIDAESDDSRWKLYAGVAAAILVLGGLGWALMSGGTEPHSTPVISDTPGPLPEVSDGPGATSPEADTAGAETSPAVVRPSIPRGDPRVEGRSPQRDRPGLGEGRPPSGQRSPPEQKERERSPSQVAGAPPKEATPEPPRIEPAQPPQTLSPEEVASAAARARERLRQQAIKALEK